MGKGVTEIKSFKEFQDIINGSTPTFIDFWATWCGPCKVISPVFAKLAEANPDANFYKVDVDEQPEIAQEVGIRAMPTFIAFKDGQPLEAMQGALPAALTKFVASHAGKAA